jgi:hypothetical protein
MQYQFLLVVVGAAIFLAVRLGRANIQCVSMGLFSIGIGCITFVFLHPDFYLSLSRAAIQSQAFDITAVAPRVNRVLGAFWSFFLPCNSDLCEIGALWPSFSGTDIAAQAVLSIALVALLAVQPLRLLVKADHFRQFKSPGAGVFFFLIWISSIVILSYLAFWSPSHQPVPKLINMI